MTHNEHHRLNYVELTVTDLPAAEAFYTAAFGWEFNHYGPEYSGIKGSDGDEVGGMGHLEVPLPLLLLHGAGLVVVDDPALTLRPGGQEHLLDDLRQSRGR